MEKYCLLRDKIIDSNIVDQKYLYVPHAATDEEILSAHDPDYLIKFINADLSPKEIRRLGLPWSKQLVERSRRSSGATIDACVSALDYGMGINLAGGTHHAFKDYGEGYCVFNDSAVAARTMIQKKLARNVLILDCDVHQGNGTASILSGDMNIFTFSIHGYKNYPHDKVESDLDIPLDDNTSDAVYLEKLSTGIKESVESFKPDLVIYLAGADPYVDDKFGRLALTKGGLAERDQFIFDFFLMAGIPIAITMAGGYAKNVKDTVEIHFQTVKSAMNMLSP